MREFVADIGNSRIKCGICDPDRLIRTAAMPLDRPEDWSRQLNDWDSDGNARWTLAGTHPGARDHLAEWLRRRGDTVRIIDHHQQVPVRLAVEAPEQIGIDRLLNALAALARSPSGSPIVIVGAGSAITVDLLDTEGVFRGGAIFPGFRLMAKTLNDYTARLPQVELFPLNPPLPGTNTRAAIEAGIAHVIQGGIERIVARYTKFFGKPRIYLAGGDADLLVDLPGEPILAGEFLTLDGIRIAAQRLS